MLSERRNSSKIRLNNDNITSRANYLKKEGYLKRLFTVGSSGFHCVLFAVRILENEAMKPCKLELH